MEKSWNFFVSTDYLTGFMIIELVRIHGNWDPKVDKYLPFITQRIAIPQTMNTLRKAISSLMLIDGSESKIGEKANYQRRGSLHKYV